MSNVTQTRVRSADTTHIQVSDLETLKIGDTGHCPIFGHGYPGHTRSTLINKYGKLDILTKSNNKTQMRHDFVGDFAN